MNGQTTAATIHVLFTQFVARGSARSSWQGIEFNTKRNQPSSGRENEAHCSGFLERGCPESCKIA